MDMDDVLDLGLGDAMPAPSKLDYLNAGLKALPGAISAIGGAVHPGSVPSSQDDQPQPRQQYQPAPSTVAKYLPYAIAAGAGLLLLKALKKR